MPAHITHQVFAEEALVKALGRRGAEIMGQHKPFLILGAQGPDMFLHNHRTEPKGLVFGKLLHTDSYGCFSRRLAERCPAANDDSAGARLAFLAGYVTHAVLDRITHPFINYFSGWVEPGNNGSERYAYCHPFLERIIDVFVLKLRKDISIVNYDFFSLVDCGEDPPSFIVSDLSYAVAGTYPEYSDDDTTRARITSAYQDTRSFYGFTNPPDYENLIRIVRDGRRSPQARMRLIALFHPQGLPDLDYLNGARVPWNHPGDPEETHTESFMDLYEQAVGAAAPVLQTVAEVCDDGADSAKVEEVVGNENLSDGRPQRRRRSLQYVNPLPLDEVIGSIHNEIRGARRPGRDA